MKSIDGFPARMEFASVPSFFFSAILPEITDMAEVKTTLHILAMLYRKKGYPRFVSYGELRENASLMKGLNAAESPVETLRRALNMAVERGTIIYLALDKDGTPEDIYFLNTASDRQIVARIQSGEIKLSGLKAAGQAYVEVGEQPDIFTLYEQNIGILTPMIAEELREAEKLYPESWLRDAVKEAVNQNKRKWSYISAILERWSAEGRTDGAHRRYSKTDPDKYIKGKYGHVVRR